MGIRAIDWLGALGARKECDSLECKVSKNTQFSLNILPYVVAMTIIIFLPRVESALMPVVKDFVVTSMSRDESSVTISGYMRKVRTCQFVGIQAAAVRGKTTYDVPLLFLDAKVDSHSTRPSGTQAWGPWRVTLPAVQADEIHLTSTHRCHPVWATDTPLASLPLREHAGP